MGSMTAVTDYAAWLATRLREAMSRWDAGRQRRREPFAYFGSFGDDFFSDE